MFKFKNDKHLFSNLLYLLFTLITVFFTCSKSSDITAPSDPAYSGPPLSYFTLFPTQLVTMVGDPVTLKVHARDTSGADVIDIIPLYSSSNTAVVRIQEDGLIIAHDIGTATITASAGGQFAETVIHVGEATYDLATLGLPKVLNANYIDLKKVERVSRFRSTVGHSYTDGSESCRSMKHYFQPKTSVDWTSVDIYAPASGTIWGFSSDGGAGSRVMLRPRDLAALQLAIFHVNLDSGIVINSWVEAGDHIGRHGSSQTMSDIAMSIGPKEGGSLISYFQVITDSVFTQFQERGVPSRESAVISKAERDADPVPCEAENQFTVHGILQDWLILN